jgi:hypothetical protein
VSFNEEFKDFDFDPTNHQGMGISRWCGASDINTLLSKTQTEIKSIQKMRSLGNEEEIDTYGRGSEVALERVSKLLQLHKRMMGLEMPNGYAIINAKAVSSDSCEIDSIEEVLRLRQPLLQVLVIQNVSGDAVKVGDFAFLKNADVMLRTLDQDERGLQTVASKKAKLLPDLLGPGDSIIVPTRLMMSYRFAYSDDEGVVSPLANKEMFMKLVKEHERVEFHSKLSIPTSQLLKNYSDSHQNLLTVDYVSGPSLELQRIEVRNRMEEIRKFDPDNIYLIDGTEGGSCPYIHTLSPESGKWESEGRILVNRSSKSREGVDAKKLKRTGGRIKIVEIDPETSYIDSVHLSVIDAKGVKRTVFPDSDLLLNRDGNYLKLGQGEEFEVHFPLLEKGAREVHLKVTGYYEPW